jgi:RNA polymerase sigma-70 factor, ECF subfamily
MCRTSHVSPTRASTASGLEFSVIAAPSGDAFDVRKAMLAALPSLRAFALSLTSHADRADDLVQDTVLRAWAHIERFQPGTNMGAWLFTILRNVFYSQCRRAKHEIADPDGSYAGHRLTAPEQDGRCDVQDLRRALAKLTDEHREALILIAAQGMSYEEAAQVCGVAVGTVKSRVHRGRAHLAQLLAIEQAEDLGPDRVTRAALQSAWTRP